RGLRVTQETDASSGLIGTTLAGRYRIVEMLGEGAMGAVYLGEHLKIGRRDAIKVLRTALARDSEAIARFTRGARIVSAVRHPNVCAIYDFGDTEDGLQFLAMEYIAGTSLKDVLARETRLPPDRALGIARQIASALDAAHDVGIIHRDLKPGNIMLVRARDGRDQVKVVDFDIAKGPETGGEEVTRLGFVVGTPEYMSPEQLMAEPLDGRSDLYSLGLILFRMIAGVLPFRGDNAQDIMVERLTAPPLTLDEVMPGVAFPERLRSLLDRALQRRAADRVANAEEFERELASLLSEPGIATALSPMPQAIGASRQPTGTTSRPEVPATRVGAAARAPAAEQPRSSPAPAQRSRRLPIAAAAGFVIVAGVASAFLILSQPDSESTTTDPATRTDGQTAPPPQPDPPPVASADTGTGGRSTVPVGAQDPSPTGQPVTPTQPPPTFGITAERANDVLFQQLETIEAPQPSATKLDAVADTAMAIWLNQSVSPGDRALAAYILGSTYDLRSDWRRCWNWLDSALVLDPARGGYTVLRDKCRGLAR
ncbi:MAG: serine/threonine-protein kinase, partial [Longimicrobiales bacterium]